MYKLMIKTHTKTNLKYLCITKRDDWLDYTGSGKYWKLHLKKYGAKHIVTELLLSTDDYEQFVKECIEYSKLYDVVNSKEWANLIPERGYENYFDASNLSIENKVIYAEKLSIAQLKYWNSLTAEERIARGQSISSGRLNMTDTDKILRADRVSKSFETSQKRKTFTDSLKITRLGIGNPSAKIYIWYGEQLSKKDFLEKTKCLEIGFIDNEFLTNPNCVKPNEPNKIYEVLTCHCGRSSEGKNPTGFLRWHMHNCRKKPNEN